MIRPIQDLYNQYKDDICVVVPFGGMNHIKNAIDNIVHRYNNRIIVIDSACFNTSTGFIRLPPYLL